MRGFLRWSRCTLTLSFFVTPGFAANLEPSDSPEPMVPSLARVIALAKAHAPDVLIGRANEATARSELVGAELPIFQNPYMEITGERASIGRDDAFVGTATAWVPFEIGGQRLPLLQHRFVAIAARRFQRAPMQWPFPRTRRPDR